MGRMPLLMYGPPFLVALCLTCSCPIRVLAEAPGAPAALIGSEPDDPHSDSEPALMPDSPPDKELVAPEMGEAPLYQVKK